MIANLKQRFSKEQFSPTWLGLFINPFYFARKGLWDGVRDCSEHVHGRILDIGCGQKPYRELFQYSRYDGLELDTPENRRNKKADYFYDGSRMPFGDGIFDSVIVSQVFEHVFNPDDFLDEVKRVVKDGGVVLLTVPFVWDEHEQPFDFARYSSFGLTAILEKHGFTIIKHSKTMADVRVVVQLWNAYMYKVISTGNGFIDLVCCICLLAPANLLGQLLSIVFPDNSDLYLDNIFLVRKESDG